DRPSDSTRAERSTRQMRMDVNTDDRRALKQTTITWVSATAFAVMTLLLGGATLFNGAAIQREREATALQAEFKQLGLDLAAASDLLTRDVRLYAVSTDPAHLDAYWREIDVTKTRDRIVNRLRELGAPEEELDLVALAKANSDALVDTETRAMRLTLEATGKSEAEMPAAVASYRLRAEDAALDPEAKLALARRILFDETYTKN